MERLQQFFSSNYMAPHGFCFMWMPEILWLHVIADILIALSYFSIPLALWRFAKKRPDIPFNKVFVLFATFITLCGLTHVFGIFVLWKPYYGIEGLLMLATGIVSAATAILVWRILPAAMTLPSPSELAQMNNRLSRAYEETEKQVHERTAELEAANAELIAARRKADEASRAKTEFLANMSHEIRTPMNVVAGLANILSESRPLTDKQKKYIDTMRNSADALMSLLDDLLDIARIEADQYRLDKVPTNLARLVGEAVSIMEVRANEKNLAIEFQVADDALFRQAYLADPKRCRQIVFNLCMNAIKFTEKGVVTVRLARERNTVQGGDNIVLTVADTGIGILPEKQQVIFEKFVQADNSINRKHGGTGLGLAITKTLVEQMNGAIAVTSTVDKGSVFTITLPMEQASIDPAATLPATPALAPVQIERNVSLKKKILLVEDYEPNVLVASVFLDQHGYDYEVATNGIKAVERFKQGGLDLILMDVQMPGKNGWDATTDIRAYEQANNLSAIPIIGMTAHAYIEDQKNCLRVGMNDYISKPYTADDMVAKIRAHLKS